MAVRGRKSAEAIAAVKVVRDRPEPPVELSERQAAEWRAVVDRMPAGWFERETHALLAQYRRHVERAEIFANQLQAVDAIPNPPGEQALAAIVQRVELYDKLAKMVEREGRAASSLATRLRLTQQSRVDPKTAGRAANDKPAAKKPWEFA